MEYGLTEAVQFGAAVPSRGWQRYGMVLIRKIKKALTGKSGKTSDLDRSEVCQIVASLLTTPYQFLRPSFRKVK